MPLYTRDNLESLLQQTGADKTTPVYLLIGDRFLCQQTAQELEKVLLTSGGSVHPIDGENENISSTINKLRSFSLFPGRQIYRVTDSKLFHSKNIAGNIWKKALKAKVDNQPERAAGHLFSMLQIAGMEKEVSDQPFESMSKSQWKKVFGFAMPDENMAWTSEALSNLQSIPESQSSPAGGDPASLIEQVLDAGIPPQNFLILLTEDADKRKRFFKLLKDRHTVVDLSVDTGSSAGAKKEQRGVLIGLIRKTLDGFGKQIHPKAAELLLDRVGFHPVAVVMEVEKLALYADQRKTIELEDLEELVGRTRQEALYELTEALGNKNTGQALLVAKRLRDNNIHDLAIIATLRNYAGNLLLFRSLLEQPEYGYQASMSPGSFQNQCLPRLKDSGNWTRELSIHPYALYMQFKTASGFPLATLQTWPDLLLAAEMKLKGSAIESATILEHLILAMLADPAIAALKK